MNHRCIVWGLSAATLTFAWQAFAQEPALPIPAEVGLLIELIRNGGMPTAVGLLAFFIGRGKGLTITVALGDEAMKLLERLAKAIEEMKSKGD